METGGKTPPEAEALLVFWTFNRSCKFAYFSKILKQRNQVSWVATKLGGGELEQNWGPPAQALNRHWQSESLFSK